MKSIHTLIPDIYELVGGRNAERNGEGPTISRELAEQLSGGVADRIYEHFAQSGPGPKLRMSALGQVCPCSLWYRANKPELAEALPPWAKIKYAYGHIIEALAITLAKAAGHTVEGEQDVVELDGVKGHRDCIIDGCVVDVKSASSKSFIKFKDGSIRENDNFGYLEQLDGYVVASANDPLVRVKDKGYLLAIDKTLGHMALYEHVVREDHIRKRIRDHKSIIALDRPPRCTCEEVPYGASGNIALGPIASYNPFKFSCKPHLRVFLYKERNGFKPVYLTKVVRVPDVTEIDRLGNVIRQ